MSLSDLKRRVGGAIVGPPRPLTCEAMPRLPKAGPDMNKALSRSRSWAGFCLPAQNQGSRPSCTMEGWCNIKECLLKARGIPIPHGYQLNGPALHKITQERYYGGDPESGATDEIAWKVAVDEELFGKKDDIVACENLDAEIKGMAHSPLSYCFNVDGAWDRPGKWGYIVPGTKWLGGHKVICCEIYEDARGNVYQGGENSWGVGWGWSGWWLMHRASILKTRSSSGPYYVKEHASSANDTRWQKWLVRNY